MMQKKWYTDRPGENRPVTMLADYRSMGCMNGDVQDEEISVALSRCRWTIVVVLQFSLIAISRIHPPTGM